jgi:hypothetical protein
MVSRVSRLGPKRLLTAEAAAPAPPPWPRCHGGDGSWRCTEGAAPRSRADHWCEAELSACCAAAALSSALSSWNTRLSLEVATSGQPRSSIAATARFCDAHLKSGGVSSLVLPFASTFAPSLVCRLSSCVRPRANGVRARTLGCSKAGRRSCRSSFPSQRCSCTGTCCDAGCGVGRRLQGPWSSPSSRWRLASSLSS